MVKRYNWQNIRAMLTEGFTAEELRRFCYYEPNFKPVYHQLTQATGKMEIVDLLIKYAEQKLQIDTLLAWAEENNPARYEKHQPYVVTDTYENQRQAQLITLTKVFFADLHRASTQIVVAIDTFEKATSEVQAWISDVFLLYARRTPGVVVIIAGQSVPDLDREWDEYCCHCPLRGLRPEHWHEYAQRVGVTLSKETTFAFHKLFDGIPGEMEKAFQKLMEGAVQ